MYPLSQNGCDDENSIEIEKFRGEVATFFGIKFCHFQDLSGVGGSRLDACFFVCSQLLGGKDQDLQGGINILRKSVKQS